MEHHDHERSHLHLVAHDGMRVEEHYNLRLYVAGKTPKSLAAIANLKRLCADYLHGRCTIEVIDLMEQPQLAEGDQIVAVPTLVRRLPPPLKRIVGTLSDMERVLVGLDLRKEGKPHDPRAD